MTTRQHANIPARHLRVRPPFRTLILALGLAALTPGCPPEAPEPAPATDAQIAGPSTAEQVAIGRTKVEALLEKGDVHGAVAKAWQLTQDLPREPDAAISLAAAYTFAGRHTDALREAERALVLNTNIPGAHMSHGVALGGLGRNAEALAATRKALVLDPKHPGAQQNLARFLGSTGAFKEQADALRIIIKRDSNDATARVALAVALSAGGDFEAARAIANDIIDRAPYEASGHTTLAAISYADERYLETMDQLSIALKLEPDDLMSVTLFQAATFMAIAATLRCAHGPAPWTESAIAGVLKRFDDQGLAGAEIWRAWWGEHQKNPDVATRLARAAEHCGLAALPPLPQPAP